VSGNRWSDLSLGCSDEATMIEQGTGALVFLRDDSLGVGS